MSFAAYEPFSVDAARVAIAGVKGGNGPPLLLLHGHPQTHEIWHKCADVLARHFTVIATDLRGYGASAKPESDEEHTPYSKRAMAADQVAVMRHFGYERFLVCAHDRGARVAHRMAMDFPGVVDRLMLLDIAPTLAMYEKTSMEFAMAYYHWFFLIRPAPYPETLINGAPDLYLRHTIGGRSAGLAPFTEEAYAEYLRCISNPETVHGICEDYRASASIDLEHERQDLREGRKIVCPMLALWGQHGAVGKCFDPLAEWRPIAADVRGKALDCGHYIPEEAPDALLAEAGAFLGIAL
jgi:haloacetate dehalogenase